MKMTKSKRKNKVDMSPEAIDRRLREVAQLYKLGVEIRSARFIGKVEDIKKQQAKNQR